MVAIKDETQRISMQISELELTEFDRLATKGKKKRELASFWVLSLSNWVTINEMEKQSFVRVGNKSQKFWNEHITYKDALGYPRGNVGN